MAGSLLGAHQRIAWLAYAAEHQQTSWPLLTARPARPNTSNTPTPVNPTSFFAVSNQVACTFLLWQPYEMDPPNLGALDLSDSDTDALFDTPAVRKAKKKIKDEVDAGDTAASGKARAKESHYTAEEAREGALRRELESIRNVNKVIEGVIESLQKAKDNMAVRGARASRHSARANGSLRPYHVPFKMHRPCSTHGPGYCPRPSTISGSF